MEKKIKESLHPASKKSADGFASESCGMQALYLISLTWRDVYSFWKYCFKSWKECFCKTKSLPWNYFTRSIDPQFRNSSCQWFKLENTLWFGERVEREPVVVHICSRSCSHGRFPPGTLPAPGISGGVGRSGPSVILILCPVFPQCGPRDYFRRMSDERADFSLGT